MYFDYTRSIMKQKDFEISVRNQANAHDIDSPFTISPSIHEVCTPVEIHKILDALSGYLCADIADPKRREILLDEFLILNNPNASYFTFTSHQEFGDQQMTITAYNKSGKIIDSEIVPLMSNRDYLPRKEREVRRNAFNTALKVACQIEE